jgi:hypothetical protein
MDHSGRNKKKVGTAQGTMIGRLNDGAVLTVDFRNNTVNAWRDSKSTLLYKSDDQILNASTAGERIWVMHDGYFGLLEDGELAFILPGYVVQSAYAGDETVMLVDETLDGEATLSVYAALDNAERLIELGEFPNVFNPRIALMDDGSVVIMHESAFTFVAELSSDRPYWDYAGEYHLSRGEDILETDTSGEPMSDEEWKIFLRGSWHADTAVGSGYAERLIFTDGMCAALPSEYEGDYSTPNIAFWTVVDGRLEINSNGSSATLPLNWFIAEEDEGLTFHAIIIENITLYKMSDEPGYYPDLEDYGIVINGDEISIGAVEIEEGD